MIYITIHLYRREEGAASRTRIVHLPSVRRRPRGLLSIFPSLTPRRYDVSRPSRPLSPSAAAAAHLSLSFWRLSSTLLCYYSLPPCTVSGRDLPSDFPFGPLPLSTIPRVSFTMLLVVGRILLDLTLCGNRRKCGQTAMLFFFFFPNKPISSCCARLELSAVSLNSRSLMTSNVRSKFVPNFLT